MAGYAAWDVSMLLFTATHSRELRYVKSNVSITAEGNDIYEKILKYKNYFGQEGGVTFSGGEPFLQSSFLLDILKKCKQNIKKCLQQEKNRKKSN